MKVRSCSRFLFLIVFSLLVLFPGESRAGDSPVPADYVHADFLIGFRGSPATFVIRLQSEEAINEAREILVTGSRFGPMLVGQVLPGRTSYNRLWRFHLDPNATGFSEVMKEVCDASPMYVQRHLSEVGTSFLPGGLWCPWNSYLIAEIR